MKEAKIVNKDLTIVEVAKIMSKENIGSIIIDFGDESYGIITEKDITNNVKNVTKKVSEICPQGIITISKDNTLEEAAEIMNEHKIKRIPVSENKKIVGIITVSEIIENSDDLNENDFWVN